jgi:hypothetical protein
MISRHGLKFTGIEYEIKLIILDVNTFQLIKMYEFEFFMDGIYVRAHKLAFFQLKSIEVY